MKALYFGTYDREHPRNVNAIAALARRRRRGRRAERSRARARLPRCARRRTRPRASCWSAPPRVRRRDRRLPGPLRRARRPDGSPAASRSSSTRCSRSRTSWSACGAASARARPPRPCCAPSTCARCDCPTSSSAAPTPRRRTSQSLGAKNVASVFLGADEELYRHTWSPTYPFTAVHFATGMPGDGSADVVRIAASLHDVSGADRRARRDRARRSRDRRRARRDRARELPRVASDPAGRLRRTRDRSAGRSPPTPPRRASSCATASRRCSCRPPTREALAGAIERLAADEELRARIGAARPRGVRGTRLADRARRPLARAARGLM